MKDAIAAPSEAYKKSEQQRMRALGYDTKLSRCVNCTIYGIHASWHFYQKDCNKLLLRCSWQRFRTLANKAIQRISKRCISSKSLRRRALWRNAVPTYFLRSFHFSSLYILFLICLSCTQLYTPHTSGSDVHIHYRCHIHYKLACREHSKHTVDAISNTLLIN